MKSLCILCGEVSLERKDNGRYFCPNCDTLPIEKKEEKEEDNVIGEFKLPNGHTCIIQENKAGGRSYISDEVGGGVLIYDTCLQDPSSVLACLTKEAELAHAEWEKVNARARQEEGREI